MDPMAASSCPISVVHGVTLCYVMLFAYVPDDGRR